METLDLVGLDKLLLKKLKQPLTLLNLKKTLECLEQQNALVYFNTSITCSADDAPEVLHGESTGIMLDCRPLFFSSEFQKNTVATHNIGAQRENGLGIFVSSLNINEVKYYPCDHIGQWLTSVFVPIHQLSVSILHENALHQYFYGAGRHNKAAKRFKVTDSFFEQKRGELGLGLSASYQEIYEASGSPTAKEIWNTWNSNDPALFQLDNPQDAFMTKFRKRYNVEFKGHLRNNHIKNK